MFFQGFLGWLGVGSLKRRVRHEKLHAAVARSTFATQNAQNTPASDHFLKFSCRKMARRCGAKQLCNSKCAKHTSFGPLFEVQLSKNGTPLWREAHLQLKMLKNCWSGTFGSSAFQNKHAAVAQSTFASQNLHKAHHSRATF